MACMFLAGCLLFLVFHALSSIAKPGSLIGSPRVRHWLSARAPPTCRPNSSAREIARNCPCQPPVLLCPLARFRYYSLLLINLFCYSARHSGPIFSALDSIRCVCVCVCERVVCGALVHAEAMMKSGTDLRAQCEEVRQQRASHSLLGCCCGRRKVHCSVHIMRHGQASSGSPLLDTLLVCVEGSCPSATCCWGHCNFTGFRVLAAGCWLAV